ncbi:MAG: S24/S26 family peptidase [Planctomycetes bacterium]|nr:S24/S26 family peptidase [Planctomycetota bacterium]
MYNSIGAKTVEEGLILLENEDPRIMPGIPGAVDTISMIGGSMMPLLRPGDALHVDISCDKPLIKGDIVAISSEAGTIVHYFLGTTTKRFSVCFVHRGFRGISSLANPDQLIGVVAAVTRNGRTFGIAELLAKTAQEI